MILAYSCCSLNGGGYAAEIMVPQGIYDGETLTVSFPYTVIGDPSGTTVFSAGELTLKNLDNSIAALPLSCFGNLLGSFTVLGRGHSLTFENIRTSTNGAALSNSAADGLFTIEGFKELSFPIAIHYLPYCLLQRLIRVARLRRQHLHRLMVLFILKQIFCYSIMRSSHSIVI